MKAIINAKIFYKDEILENYTICFDRQIRIIDRDIDVGEMLVIDAKGAFVSAGFIDLHIHGSNGADVMDASPKALETISKSVLSGGTTSFLATTMTMSAEDIDKALINVQVYGKYVTGANILGIHLEGPFINPSRHGAQDIKHIQSANMEMLEGYLGDIKMITIAPEIAQNKALIQNIKENYPDIILSIGHSDASYKEAKDSFGYGISHATHLFNAMNSYHHRDPSIVGAVFDSDISCDVIADLVHIHPSTLNLIHKIKKDKLVLITDSIRAGCLKSGIYDLGGRVVSVSGDKASLIDGTIAGSVLQMNQAVRNMIINTSMSPIEAINSVTKIPAKMLNLKKGELLVEYDADIVIFDDSFDIIVSIVGGEIVFESVDNTKKEI